MNIPKVEKGKFIIIISDFNTGIVLNEDGSNYLGTGNSYYKIMNNHSDAEEYALNEIYTKKRNVEISIYDNEAFFVKMFRPNSG